MPTLRYALEPNGPRRLELAWEGQYQHFVVRLDDVEVGRVEGPRALAAGQRLPLPDGSELELKVAGTSLMNELRVLRNGWPVPGSASHPAVRLRTTVQVLGLVGVVYTVVGFLGGLVGVAALRELGASTGTLLLGGLYLLLAALVQHRSVVALLLAVALFGLETVMGLLVAPLTGSTPNLLALLVRALVLWVLITGFGPLRQLLREPTPAAA